MFRQNHYKKIEVEERKQNRDPITLARLRLERDFPHLTPELSSIEEQVEKEVLDSVAFAEQSPFPSPKDIGEYTYVE